MISRNPIRGVVLGAVLLSLGGGCGWVDSTGRQGNSAPDSELLQDDGTTLSILSLNEQDSIDVIAVGSDPDGDALSWSWSESPVAEGALAECAGIENFPAQFMEENLAAACTDASSCVINFDEISSDANQSVFRISTPRLKASIGLVYNLVSQDSAGATSSRPYTFCLAAINEAPEAIDDSFALLEGNQLVVTADQTNLLSNDEDDIDYSNQALSVTRVVTPPLAASVFEIRADGGFTYAFAGVNPTAEIQDSFVYEITDGTHVATATAVINIVPQDDPPEKIVNIPTQTAIAGIEFFEDLSTYFLDPENGALSFFVDETGLPPSGEIFLDVSGILSGVAEADDVGDYLVPMVVSDGNSGITASFELEIVDNEPVETDSVGSLQTSVGRRFTLSMGQYFEDPEGQPLTFDLEVDSSRAALTINTRTGVITGFFRAARRYELEVSADDGFNEPSVIVVSVRVQEDS